MHRCVSESCKLSVDSNVATILRRARRQASLSIIFIGLTSAVGHAAGAAGSPAAPEESSTSGTEAGALSEIVVTARRKDELLQDVPQTVSAVTASEIQKLNLQNLSDISGVVPGLQIFAAPDPDHDTVTLRGVSFNPTSGTQNSVAFYINDVPVSNSLLTTSNFDVGQIEVLSGPQGTLRGEPAPSGSLTITTHQADLEQFGGYATVTGTQYGNNNENAAVNLPLIKDMLAIRLAGIANDDDYNGVKSLFSSTSPYNRVYGGRASIRFQPVDALEGNVVYQHMFTHQEFFPQVQGQGASGGVNPNAPAGYNGPPISAFDRRAVQTLPTTNYIRSDIVTGKVDSHVLDQVVSYDGSYSKYATNTGDGASAANQVPGITASNPIPRQPFQFDTPLSVSYEQTNELRVSSESPVASLFDYTAVCSPVIPATR